MARKHIDMRLTAETREDEARDALHALARIASMLNARDWNADLCDDIADVLRAESYPIRKP